jgi:DoxX-like family
MPDKFHLFKIFKTKIMSAKTINILYWVFTVLFSGLMIFSSVGGIGPSDPAIEVLNKGLGYPIYFIQFISWAKIVGAIAILIPGFKRIKEWAYAGLFFDLAGATYSGVAVSGKFDPMMLTLLLWMVPGILSYIYWNKKQAL